MTRPDYTRHDPKGWCGDPRRGAAMGRPHLTGHGPDFDEAIFIQAVALNQGGYDRLGTYFGDPGTGETLFWVASVDGVIDYMHWAPDRKTVETQARQQWPRARIRRSAFSSDRRRWKRCNQAGRSLILTTPVAP